MIKSWIENKNVVMIDFKYLSIHPSITSGGNTTCWMGVDIGVWKCTIHAKNGIAMIIIRYGSNGGSA